MSNFDELLSLDATSQAELIRRKECQPLELVDAAIERIERLNPILNAVVTQMYDVAREAAKGDLPDGPFKGVPFLVKDLIIEVKGVRYTEGSAFLKNFVSDYDSTLAKRLRQAGLIILGKTNTPEFGLLSTTEPEFHGPCRNPWNPEKTPGGSSGGASAAVASGMVPMAHGNDGAGSIRIPASCCGLFGLKPTRARNPLGPAHNDIILSSTVCEHAITRSVRDSARLLDATCGHEIGAPYQVGSPKRLFEHEISKAPSKLRIAFTERTLKNEAVHPDCVEAVRDAAKLCSDLGHEVVEDSPLINKKLMSNYGYIWSLLPVWFVDNWARRTGQKPLAKNFEEMTWALYQRGMNAKAIDFMKAQMKLPEIYVIMGEFLRDYDIWLTPTLSEPPVDIGVIGPTPDNPLNGFYRSGAFAPFTAICNVAGLPAMSMPLFWNSAGLPIGTHFVGRYGDEATLFRLAAQLEQARPWIDKKPPNHCDDELQL